MEDIAKSVVPTMRWSKWKRGAIVSAVLSLFVAMSGVAEGSSWKQFVAVLGAALVTHFGAYLTEHPVEKIED